MNVFYEFNGTKHNTYCDDLVYNQDLYDRISADQNLSIDLFQIYLNGRHVRPDQSLIEKKNDLFINLTLPLVGGKGGFGSMLRAIGAQIEKTTNKEACRDLSGRRLRDVNAEKRVKNWIKKKAEKQKELERKKREKLERMTLQPKVDFEDDDYLKEKDVIPQKVDDAIDYLFKKKSSKKVASSTATSVASINKAFNNEITSSSKIRIDENNQPCTSNSESNETSNSESNSTDSNDLVSSSVIESKIDRPTSSDSNNSLEQFSDRSSSPKSSNIKPIGIKRKVDEPSVVCKKKKVQLWLGDDLDDSNDSDEE